MFLLLWSLMHEYTIMKWLAGLPPVFASSSPLTSTDSFTRVCFFTFPPAAAFSPAAAFLLFHQRLFFCFPAVPTACVSTICASVLPPSGWVPEQNRILISCETSNPLPFSNAYNFDVKMIEIGIRWK